MGTNFATYLPGVGSVYGVGSTPEEALEDARQWADTLDGLETVPCTPALADRVRAWGGEFLHIQLQNGTLILG